jgi:hypothetical protein
VRQTSWDRYYSFEQLYRDTRLTFRYTKLCFVGRVGHGLLKTLVDFCACTEVHKQLELPLLGHTSLVGTYVGEHSNCLELPHSKVALTMANFGLATCFDSQ